MAKYFFFFCVEYAKPDKPIQHIKLRLNEVMVAATAVHFEPLQSKGVLIKNSVAIIISNIYLFLSPVFDNVNVMRQRRAHMFYAFLRHSFFTTNKNNNNDQP